jgi:hypothetical protein
MCSCWLSVCCLVLRLGQAKRLFERRSTIGFQRLTRNGSRQLCCCSEAGVSLHVDRPIRKCLGCSQFRKLTTPVYRPGQPQREDGADHADERHLRRSASGPHCRIGLRLRLSSPPELVHPQTSVGDVRLLLCHPLWDLANINKTPWAARAWTFQECYFAKRRLFIYHGQAAYRCNSSSGSFGKAGWYPQFDRQDLRIEYTKELVQGYTGRQLTFESDALPTIISALSGDERQEERRDIWGLPVNKGSMDWGVDASLALLWRHDLQCTRRPTLPSWSPIAWTGAISWPMAHDVSARGIRLLQAAEGVLKFRSSMQQGLRRTTRCHDTWRSRAEY